MKLQAKVAVVTGAASGFGAEIARRFANEGAQVVLADIDTDGARREAEAIGEGAVAMQADVTRRDDVARMILTAEEAFGRIDILVNNAGFTHINKSLLDVSEEEFDRIFAVNVKSIYLATQEVVPGFRKAGGGNILNIASTAGLRPRPGLTWYNGSKGAAITLTKSMAVELAPDKIRVNALCPVISATPMLERFMGGPDTSENRAKFVQTIPLGRMGEARDVASAALFLCSPEAEFLTGVALEVDGGRCI